MVTAGNGAITFTGRSGKAYTINFYSSDVIGASCTFNTVGVAVAGSTSFYLVPEDVVVTDISFASTNTVSTNFVPYVNDVPIGSAIPIANILNTLNNRSFGNFGIRSGKKFTLIQA
jgi:hypothetical protein